MQPGGFDFGALMAQAAEMQQQMADAQASLADERVTGSAAGGLVTAEVDGNGQLVGLTIDPSVVDPDDIDLLADLVVAAVRDGARAAEVVAQRKMGGVASGLAGGLGGGLADGLPAGLLDDGLLKGLGLPGLPGAADATH